jgi:hypothetical protein
VHYSGESIQPKFKRIPAVDKPFAILNFVAKNNESMVVSEMPRALAFNKGSEIISTIHPIWKQSTKNQSDSFSRFAEKL